MVDDVQFSILGLDSLLGKLESITYDMKRKGGRSALRKAAQLVANAAKENAKSLDDPETGRSIADNIGLRWSRRRFEQTGDLMFRVGVLKGAKFTRGEQPTEAGAATPHFRLLEFGTANMPAQPFLRRALSENIQAATNEFVTSYEKAIDRAIKRAAKKSST